MSNNNLDTELHNLEIIQEKKFKVIKVMSFIMDYTVIMKKMLLKRYSFNACYSS
jgi:hypothetical protein